MNNQVQIFENQEFGKVRVLDINGQPWFVGKDVTSILGYKNGSRDINRHVGAEDRQNYRNSTSEFNNRGVTIINESGLYSLILSSKLPIAKNFKHWITSHVIPSIRRTGAYITPDALDNMIRSPEFTTTLLCTLQKEQQQNKALLDVVEELRPKAAYCEKILGAKGTIPITIISKEYGLSAVEFNILLRDLGIQYKVGNAWVLCQKYADKGYTKTLTYFVNEDNAKVLTRWTQAGRLFLYEHLKNYGIIPISEASDTLSMRNLR